MADFESMRKKHRKDSMLTLSFLIFILLLFIFDDYFISIFTQLIKSPANLFSIVGQSWVKFLSTILVPFISYFLGILTIAKRDIYYDIDNFFFKRRKKVDKFICEKMINFRTRLSPEENKKIKKLRDAIYKKGRVNLLMELFYKYIEQPEIVNPGLKTQAFIYWGDYFSKVTFIFLGIIFLIGASIIAIISGFFSYFRLIRLILLVLVTLLVFRNFCSIFWGKTAKKLFEIPRTQIGQIHRNSKAEQNLLTDLRSENFGVNHETSS